MSTKSAFLTASLAALALAFPAQAQDSRYDAPSEPIAYESYEVVQDKGAAPGYNEQSDGAYRYDSYARPVDYPALVPEAVVTTGPSGPPRGYSPQQRSDWLTDCRAIYLPAYSDRRYDDYARHAERTDQADAYCSDYLARYEGGGFGGYPMGAYPVMMVPVQTTRRIAAREVVYEEWVDVDAPPRPARRSIPRRLAPQPDKRTSIR
ncbi:hypothetical protein [Aurantiacibacter suaedae]|uniref:hypothetical protein n=1 Tax=Aurantiacibacter suaedae TaxID=2545755 RepID=UPI0010F451EA|nr:hypothetical protein [Aurantiacibacter suaedae]